MTPLSRPREIYNTDANISNRTNSPGNGDLSDLRLLLIMQENENQKQLLRQSLMHHRQQLLLRQVQEQAHIENMLLLSQQSLYPSSSWTTTNGGVRDGAGFSFGGVAEASSKSLFSLSSRMGVLSNHSHPAVHQQPLRQRQEHNRALGAHKKLLLMAQQRSADATMNGVTTDLIAVGLKNHQHQVSNNLKRATATFTQLQIPSQVEPTKGKRVERSDHDKGIAHSKRRKKISFEERLEQLKEFKQKFGHMNVSQRPGNHYCTLGHWVNTQRTHYKRFKNTGKSFKTEKQFELLDSLGFVWSPTFSWDEMYEKLCWHKERYGNINIPTRFKNRQYNRLGKWLYVQRHRYQLLKQGKKSPLKPRQIELLSKLGIDWSMQGGKNGNTPNTYDCRDSMVHKKTDIAAASLAAAEGAVTDTYTRTASSVAEKDVRVDRRNCTSKLEKGNDNKPTSVQPDGYSSDTSLVF